VRRPGAADAAAVGTDGVGTAAVTVGVVGGADEADFAAVKGFAARIRSNTAAHFYCPFVYIKIGKIQDIVQKNATRGGEDVFQRVSNC
jgi:hypothetical protein